MATVRRARPGSRGPLRLAEGDPVTVRGQPGKISGNGREGHYWREQDAYLVHFEGGSKYYVGADDVRRGEG